MILTKQVENEAILFIKKIMFVVSTILLVGCDSDSKKEEVLSNVTLSEFRFYTGGFGAVLMVDGMISNNSQYRIKDIVLRCDHYTNSNTRIDYNIRTIYEYIGINQSINLTEFNMGYIHPQAITTACRVTDFVML
jgi:hypothetical protein